MAKHQNKSKKHYDKSIDKLFDVAKEVHEKSETFIFTDNTGPFTWPNKYDSKLSVFIRPIKKRVKFLIDFLYK